MTGAKSATWHVPEPSEIISHLRTRLAACRAWLAIPANAWLTVLLVISLLARLSALDLAPMRPEQAHWLATAHQFSPAASLTAPLTTTAAPGPLTVLIGGSIGRDGDARGAIALLALLQWIALAALALSLNRHLGHVSALVSTGMLGASPWAIFAARALSPSSLTLAASMLLLATLLSAIIERNGWAWSAAILLSVMAVGNDPGALALGVLCLGAIVIYYDRVHWAAVVVGLALALVVALTTDLGSALLSHLMPALPSTAQQGYVERLLACIRQVTALLSGHRVGALLGPTEASPLLTYGLFERLRQGLGLLVWLALPWIAFQAFQSWGRWQANTRGHGQTLLALWLWLPLLLGPRVDVEAAGWLGPATALVVLPGAAAASGLLVEVIARELRQSGLGQSIWLTVGLGGLLALALVANLYAAQAIPRMALKQPADGYGTPYRAWLHIQDLVVQGRSQNGADQLWVQTSDEVADTVRILWPEAIALRDDSATLLPAARPGLYLRWDDGPGERGPLERLGAQEVGRVAWPTGQDAVVLELRERNVAELLALANTRTEAHFDAGLYLVGYDWPPDAQRHKPVHVATYWTFANVSSSDRAASHTIYLAAIADDGRQAVWSGPLALDGAYWQEGLLLRHEIALELPSDWPDGPLALYAEVHRDGEPVVLLDTPIRGQEITASLGTVTID
ncbi:MAG: hypothetical protein GXY68_02400 [Chloroflexi bacterium]|nr:hypothetical protein [Chloroflexota bacterium]